MSKMSELHMVAEEVMEYENAVRDKLRMDSWPAFDLDGQRRFFSEFINGIGALRDYFELTWPAQEIVRDYLTDNNYHSAVKGLELFTVCSFDL